MTMAAQDPGPDLPHPDWPHPDRPQPDWNDIRIFIAIADTGSLTAAAQRLGVSQPTVGRRLRALERRLGLRLGERMSTRIELTEAGRELRARAERMQAAADALVRDARLLAAEPAAPVRVSATGSIALFLSSHLGELCSRAGGIRIELEVEKGRANLARREADIAIRMRRLPVEGDMVARRLATLAFCIYGPAGSVPDALPVIGLPKTDRRPSQSAFLDSWADGRTMLLRSGDIAIRHAAMKSAGAATLLPCWLGDGDPGIVRLIPPDLREDAWLLVHRDTKRNGSVDRLAAALSGLFKAQADRLAGNSALPA